MGFMAGLATGFFKQQNADVANQQAQTDKLTQLSLANILKNVDSYNASKAEYQQRVTKAQAIADASGGTVAPGDAMNAINLGVPDPASFAMMNALRTKNSASAANTNQQTQAAIPGAGASTNVSANGGATTNTPAAPTATPGTAPQPTSPMGGGNSPNPGTTATSSNPQVAASSAPQQPDQSAPGVRPTLINHIFGTDPGANIGAAATSQAGAVTGLSGDELAQARTGHYQPTALPVSPGYHVDPSSFIDFSKINAGDYSAKNLPLAIAAAKQGDFATVAALRDNADTKAQRAVSTYLAEKGADQKDEFIKFNHDVALAAALPGPDGKPIGIQAATQALLTSKYKGLGAALGGDDESLNPNHLDPVSFYQTLPADQKAWYDGYTSGRVPWTPGMGGSGQALAQENLKKIQLVDPTFSPAVAKARQAMYADFNSTKNGTTGAKLVSAGTIINHLTDFLTNINAVGNTHSFTPLNSANNAWAALNSNANLKDAEQAQGYAAEEMSKFLAEKGQGATDTDKQRTIGMMPLNIGGKDPVTGQPNNQKIVDNLLNLMVGKLGPIADKINDTYGTNVTAYDLLPPTSVNKLKALGYKVPEGSGETVAPNGVAAPLPRHLTAPTNWSNDPSAQATTVAPNQVQELPILNGHVDPTQIRPDATYRTTNGPVKGADLLAPQGTQ